MKGAKDKDKKGSKPSPIKDEEKELSIDFLNPLALINVLDETSVGRILQALKGLKPFIRQNSLVELLEKGLIEKLVRFINDKKSAVEVLEFSIELLSELLNFKIVTDRMAEEKELIILLYTSVKTRPLDVQVQCLKCLSSLTSASNICEVIAENCDLNLLFLRLSQKDPDVQACILKILYNLVTSDIVIAEKVVNAPGFGYSQFLHLLNSEYPLVQHRSLKMIYQLTSYDHVEVLKKMFIDERGIDALIQILETHKWPDLHDKVFNIFINMSSLDETFDKMADKGIKMMVAYVDDIESLLLQFKCYSSIMKITKNSPYGLKFFLENGLFDLIVKYIEYDSSDMFKLSVAGLAAMSESNEAMFLMESKPALIQSLFTLLKNMYSHMNWPMSYNAATAIHLMISKSDIFYDFVIKNKLWAIILKLINQNNPKPYDLTLLLATILRRMIRDVYFALNCPSKQCNKLIVALQRLIMNPKGGEDQLKCVGTEMVEELVEFYEFREELKNKRLYKSLSKLLFRTSENLTVLEAYLKLFISLIEWDSSFIGDLNYILAIEWFIDRREILRNLPIAVRFLDSVFDKCKHLKFHFTNRLEPWDKIKTGFYAQRAFSEKSNFKLLKAHLKETCLKERSCYYVNFNDSDLIPRNDGTSSVSSLSNFDAISVMSEDNDCFVDFMETLNDPFICDKLENLKVLLGYLPQQQVVLNLSEALDREKYISHVKILSEYICKLLSGEDEEEVCQKHSFGLHISEIKKKLRNTVIPLGYLKLGLKFEKALLFKTLGDQVGIPSALVRGSCGTGWNEIYLPPVKEFGSESVQVLFSKEKNIISKDTDSTKKEKSILTQSQSYTRKSTTKLDRKASKKSLSYSKSSLGIKEPVLSPSWYLHAYQSYMETNHIVDLDKDPGALYQIESVEADNYITKAMPVHPYFYRRTNLPPRLRNIMTTETPN